MRITIWVITYKGQKEIEIGWNIDERMPGESEGCKMCDEKVWRVASQGSQLNSEGQCRFSGRSEQCFFYYCCSVRNSIERVMKLLMSLLRSPMLSIIMPGQLVAKRTYMCPARCRS